MSQRPTRKKRTEGKSTTIQVKIVEEERKKNEKLRRSAFGCSPNRRRGCRSCPTRPCSSCGCHHRFLEHRATNQQAKKKYPRRSRPSSRLLAAMDPLCYSCAFFTVVVSEFPEPQQGQQPTDANVFAAVVRIESVVDDVDGVVGVVVLADEGVDGHSAGGHRLAVEHGQTQAGRTSCAPTNTKQKRPLIGCP